MKKSLLFFLCVLVFTAILLPETGRSEEITLHVLAEKANLRAGPGTNTAIVAQVTAGTSLTSDRKEGNWYRVMLPPEKGGVQRYAFIHDSLVEVLLPAEESATEKQGGQRGLERKVSPAPKKIAPGGEMVDRQPVVPGKAKFWSLEFGLRLSGGYDFLIGKNTMNDALRGISDLYSDSVDFYNMTTGNISSSGSLEPLKSGPSMGGEFFINVNPFLGFGLGAGYLTGTKEGTLAFEENLTGSMETVTYSQKISSSFVQLTVRGGVPFGNRLRLVPYLGGGIYYGKVTVQSLNNFSDPSLSFESRRDQTWVAYNNVFGMHGGLNIEFYFTPNIGVFFGVGGLLAAFKDLVGDTETNLWDNWYGSESVTEKDQKLWAGEADYSIIGLCKYPVFYLDDEKPASIITSHVEPGVISISQYRILMGVTVYLMR